MSVSCNPFKIFLLITGIYILLAGCSKTEEKTSVKSGPSMSGIRLSGDNREVQLVFSEGVYKGGFSDMPITNNELLVSLSGGQALLDSFRVVHTAGQNTAMIWLYLAGIANGSEMLLVKPAGPLSVVNAVSVPMKETEQRSIGLADIGIIGSWVSTGANLSPVFQQFGFDSVYMQYNSDRSYIFESFTPGGVHNILSGTFHQTVSVIEGLRLIVLVQQSPVQATISGIFRLYNEDPIRLVYETVQTEPAVAGLTPPTPELGFGSTGMLGSDNTQVFLKINAE